MWFIPPSSSTSIPTSFPRDSPTTAPPSARFCWRCGRWGSGIADKGNLSMPWPSENMNIRLNTDTGLLKLIAIVTMLIDHMGAIFFPQYRVMRVIGRIAFPIYAYCLTVGCVYTHDMLRYVQRIVLLALVSQPLYVVAMHHTNPAMYAVSFVEQPVRAAFNFYINSWQDPSILLSLALGLILLWSIRDRHLVITA